VVDKADSLGLITESELARLFKILGMLGSAHDGERAAAALKATAWLTEHATSWQALILPEDRNPVVSVGVAERAAPKAAPPPPPPPPPVAPSGVQVSWKAAAQAVLSHYPGVLRGQKEEDFVRGLLQKGWPTLTTKQGDWLRDICGRAGVSW
jgi:hypothetical protein